MAEIKSCGTIFSLIYFMISIAILTLTILIYNYSSKDPLEKQLEEGETWNDFFTSEANNRALKIQNEEQILSSRVNITENPLKNNTQFLRNLEMEEERCQEYKEDIIELKLEQNSTLNQVFNLHFKMIHKMALGLLTLAIIGIGVIVYVLTVIFIYLIRKYTLK